MTAASASSASVSTASVAVDPATIGSSSDTAGGSCWEIKQSRPTATDGVYWLLTPKMAEPAKFYCDMTTDGGGWVLVGKGRDGWTHDYAGKGTPSDLTSPTLATMSSATTEYPSTTVDALMNGGRVDALADGVRLRRAEDAAGATWQEVRVKYSKFGSWAWTFGAEYPISSFSFDGATTTSSTTSPTFGTDQSFKRVTNTPVAANTYKRGFAYGTSVVGSSNASTYLWSATNAGNALPYTTMWIRPKVLSTDAGFTSIPDTGTTSFAQQSVAKSTALASPWGVSGLAGNTVQEGSVEVQAFTQSGNTMYVGGNFKYVQQDAAGTGQVTQPFLAAFDVSTGQYLRSFAPVLNEQVHTLTTMPNGDVLAGGEFSTANGAPATGIVALNPTTGATDTTWKLTLADTVSGDSFRVNTLAVAGQYVYIGGAVNTFSGGSKPSTKVVTRGLGRVLATDGTPDSTWKPTMNGSVAGVSPAPDGSKLYAVGYFTKVGSVTVSKAAALTTTSPAAIATSWSPVWSSSNNYQHTVDAVGSKVWVGGSEHSLFQYDSSTLARTEGDIMKSHGDIQFITDVNGVIYAGCHCDDYAYHDAYTWPTLSTGWTRADAMRWTGAWSASTGNRIPAFTPTMTMRTGTGVWAIKGDSTGVLWVGGEVTTAATSTKVSQFAGGFARFPLNDSQAPTTPTTVQVTSQTSTSVTLSWTGSTDDNSGVHYVVMRNDRPTVSTADNASTATVPLLPGTNRLFVRAIDKAGNYSASTPVLTVTN